MYTDGQKPTALLVKTKFNASKPEESPWIYDVCKSIPEYAIRDLAKAFKNFWRGDGVGYPKFKSRKNAKQSCTLANDRFRVAGHDFILKNKKFPGVLNMAEELRFDGKINAATLSHHAGHWYVSIQVNLGEIEQEPFGPKVGVDLGIKELAVTSEDEEFENQKHLRQNLSKLAKLQRHLSRKKRGSVRWRKLQLRIDRLHARIANMRKDAAHKLTTYLCKTYGHIAIEDLNIKGMMKNRKLARAIADCGWHEIRRQLMYKGKLYRALIVVIDRWFPSSKTHAECGYVNRELTLKDRVWICPQCDELVLRDVNAAKNILNESLSLA